MKYTVALFTIFSILFLSTSSTNNTNRIQFCYITYENDPIELEKCLEETENIKPYVGCEFCEW